MREKVHRAFTRFSAASVDSEIQQIHFQSVHKLRRPLRRAFDNAAGRLLVLRLIFGDSAEPAAETRSTTCQREHVRRAESWLDLTFALALAPNHRQTVSKPRPTKPRPNLQASKPPSSSSLPLTTHNLTLTPISPNIALHAIPNHYETQHTSSEAAADRQLRNPLVRPQSSIQSGPGRQTLGVSASRDSAQYRRRASGRQGGGSQACSGARTRHGSGGRGHLLSQHESRLLARSLGGRVPLQ
jgi:hypothetical protein